jgi:nitrate/TMAO reductase-like tetraheme cytochrome c subunit
MAGARSDRFGTLDLTIGKNGKVTDFSGDAIRLLQAGPQVAEVQMLFEELDRKQRDMRREKQIADQRARDSQVREEKEVSVFHRGGVLGAESCRTCHTPQYDSWIQTPHATAFATLAEADSWDDPKCIGCHVTGVADKHFVNDVNVAPEIWNVQCEECHGLGFQHARDGSYVGLGEATCRKCHDADNSPEFEYELYSSYGVH